MQYVNPANVSIFDARVYAQPIMQQRQMQMQNALAQAMASRPLPEGVQTYSEMGVPQNVQYNALAQNGGPTRAAAQQVADYTGGEVVDGFLVSPGTRAKYAPTPGVYNISMDYNAAPSGSARGTEVIIPDDASPQVRAAAERYNALVADFARRNGIEGYPILGVRTRSENGRGVRHTIHTEPFFNSDTAMQEAIRRDPDAFASLYTQAFGGLNNARLIAPHGVGNDRGAASNVFRDETTFGQLMANSILASGGDQAAAQARSALLADLGL